MNNPILGMVLMVVTLLALIVAGVAAYMIPYAPLVWQIGLGVAGAAFIAYLAADRKSLGQMFSKKTTRFGLVALVTSTVALAIAVFSNMIVSNHDWRKDFTTNKIHSLSDQSVKVLGGLTNDVVFRAFIHPGMKTGFEEVFARYQYPSKHVKIEYVDIFRQIDLMKEYKITAPPTIIIEAGGRVSRVEGLQGPQDPRIEEKLTNGIIKVLKGGQKKVYFLTGHTEKPLSKNTADALSSLKTLMEGSRFEVHEFNLLKPQDTIPKDAEIVVMAGPKSQFQPHELKLVEEYVAAGGKLMVMVDPDSSPELKPFLAKYGVEWTPKKVLFTLMPPRQILLEAIVETYEGGHEITKEFYDASVFSLASSVNKAKEVPTGLTATSLFSTPKAYFEQEVSGARFTPDLKGGVEARSLAVAVSGKVKSTEAAKPEAKAEDKAHDHQGHNHGEEAKKDDEKKEKDFRLVVVGDSDFVANQGLPRGQNSNLFLNMMSWLANEEDLISIRPKPSDERNLNLTEDRLRIVLLATSIFMPLVAFSSAFVVRRSRRRR